MRNVSDKSCRETRNTFLMFNYFFFNHAVYEIMWKNIKGRDRPQMTTWRMRIACCTPWATNTHTGCVILIAFLQQERTRLNVTLYVHSCQQKSIGLIFSKSQTGSDVRYSCHHNSSRFTFPIFAHSCRFCILHSLQSITPRIY